MVPEIARRMMHAETQHLADPRTPFATVTSPLGSQTSKQFRLLGDSKPLDIPRDQDPRLLLAAWMKRPDNPYFARAIVSRVWAHYFGRGIVDPPDNLSPFNPASHPELLKELCEQFIKNKYDLKALHRTILTSRTYQQSSQASLANAMDRTNYAYFSYRRLPRVKEPQGFARTPPELAVEVVGKGQGWPKMLEKAGEYFAMGVDCVWIVDPRKVDPKSAMPATGITPEDARDVAAYLYAQP